MKDARCSRATTATSLHCDDVQRTPWTCLARTKLPPLAEICSQADAIYLAGGEASLAADYQKMMAQAAGVNESYVLVTVVNQTIDLPYPPSLPTPPSPPPPRTPSGGRRLQQLSQPPPVPSPPPAALYLPQAPSGRRRLQQTPSPAALKPPPLPGPPSRPAPPPKPSPPPSPSPNPPSPVSVSIGAILVTQVMQFACNGWVHLFNNADDVRHFSILTSRAMVRLGE